MSNLRINIEGKFKEGEGEITVYKNGAGEGKIISAGTHIPMEFDLPAGPDGENFLRFSLEAGENGSAKDCWLALPSMVNYEFHPEEDGAKNGNIEIIQEGGERVLKIPQGSPLNWKLKVARPTAPPHSISGTDDTVAPGGGKTGTLTSEKELPTPWMFTLDNACMLKEFSENIDKHRLTEADRLKIVDQACILIENVYVHLLLKKTKIAANPLESLRVLRVEAVERCEDGKFKMDDWAFHSRMLSIFNNLRDLHTRYVLPTPYKDTVAFLPFLIEEFHVDAENGKKKKYKVSKISDKADKVVPSFEEGVNITHWNGIPMEAATALNGQRNAGSNEHARRARGLEGMTIRPLKTTLPPEEDWVDITYEKDNQTHNLRFEWYAATYPKTPGSALDSGENKALGVDVKTEITRRMKKNLFFTDNNKLNKNDDLPLGPLNRIKDWEDYFAYTETNTVTKYGYVRIYSFDKEGADEFVHKFIDILRGLPENGLIVDIRGNGGGLITAGERLLQIFASPGEIEREYFEFKVSDLTLELCEKNPWLADWTNSIQEALHVNGNSHSTGYHLEPNDEYLIDDPEYKEYKYPGPVVLITDALCYSTADIFAAGFKDNKLGKILGTHENTGAGGANVWTHKFLEECLPNSEKILPFPVDEEYKNCEFRVAVRRSTRVRGNRGKQLEHQGVKPDEVHEMTEDDLMKRNKGLILKALEMLRNQV